MTPPQNAACDPVRLVETAIERLRKDVGALFDPSVIAALTTLSAQDLSAYQRLRQKAKQANPACSPTELDSATRGTTSTPAVERSAPDDLVALARAQCQLHHDAVAFGTLTHPITGRTLTFRTDTECGLLDLRRLDAATAARGQSAV